VIVVDGRWLTSPVRQVFVDAVADPKEVTYMVSFIALIVVVWGRRKYVGSELEQEARSD